MIVVSDTSPLHYLVLIDCGEVLPALFGRVIIPEAVARELESGGAPEKIRKWLATEPKWLERAVRFAKGTETSKYLIFRIVSSSGRA